MYTILIVEDTPSDMKLVESILKRKFKVITADTPTKAIAAVKKNRVDLVLLDQMLPEMSGLALQVELIKINPKMRFIMTTALDSSKLVRASLRTKKTIDFVLKPFKDNELSDAVKSAIMAIHALKEKERSDKKARDAQKELKVYKKKFGELK